MMVEHPKLESTQPNYQPEWSPCSFGRVESSYFSGRELIHVYWILFTSQGETYGLDNNKERFDDPWLFAKLRPETDVPGLYLTGK